MEDEPQPFEETPAAIVRRARGRLSLDKFAAQLGTSRQRVIAWEKGRSLPSEQYAEQIAEIAGVNPSAFERDETTGLPEQIASVYTLLDELRAMAERKGFLEPGEGAPGEMPPVLDVRLRALEEKVSQLPTADDLHQGLSTLQKAIDRLANQGTREALEAKQPHRRRGSSTK